MKRMRRSGYRTVLMLMVCSSAICSVVLAGSSVGATTGYPVGTQAEGTTAWLRDPLSHPAGVDRPSCRPDTAHPRPVVLLPGTFVRVSQGFAALGPLLANRGYCVFGLDYGDTALSTLSGGRIGAVGDIVASARQLGAAVTRIRGLTRARQVDLVGWSEGGLVARQYLTTRGAAAQVHTLVQLSTPNHGTDSGGAYRLLLATGLVPVLGALETAGGFSALALAGCDACDQQLVRSAFLAALNAHGDTVPGVRYAVLTTTHGIVNTPSSTQPLRGAAVRNISVQAACPGDTTDDLGIVYDPVALQYVLDALAPTPGFRPDCSVRF